MAKIAVELQQALVRRARDGSPGATAARVLARGDGWRVADVVCTTGPQDRPFEEQHSQFSIAIVTAGSFEYRSAAGRELMTPGSVLLGNDGQYFECAHDHGAGDRCLAFWYAPERFEALAEGAGATGSRTGFRALRLPPLRALSPLVARACAGLRGSAAVAWEELSVQIAGLAIRLAAGLSPDEVTAAPPSAMARVTRAVRKVEREAAADLGLASLAREARLSPYHFLRVFERMTGLTPHQYVRRVRLREAATRLASEATRILEIALDCGFGDVSSFNRAFRAEFGTNPRAYRRRTQARGGSAP